MLNLKGPWKNVGGICGRTWIADRDGTGICYVLDRQASGFVAIPAQVDAAREIVVHAEESADGKTVTIDVERFNKLRDAVTRGMEEG